MVDFFVCEKIILKERMVSVMKIIKQEIQFEESLKQRFGINLTQLYSILNAADERLYKKMTNVWTKYVNEKKIKHPNTEEMNFLMECYHRGIHEETDDLLW